MRVRSGAESFVAGNLEGCRSSAVRVGQGDEVRSIGPPLGFKRQLAVVYASLGHFLTGE